MSVRAIIGFDHLPQNDANWANWATHGITRGTDANSLANQIRNGWIYSVSTTAGNERVSVPLDAYMVAPVNKIWVGVRIRIRANPNANAGIIYFNGQYLLTYSEIPNNAVMGTIAHLEFSYNISTGAIERWVNGVPLAGQTGSFGRSITFGLEAKGSVAAQCDWRDIVVMDDQGASQGLPVGPIGPNRVVTPLVIESVTAPLSDWTTNNGVSLAGAVNEPGVIPTTNVATSGATKGTLVCNLKPPTLDGLNVDGIEMVAAGSSTTVSPTNLGMKLKNGSQEIAGPNAVLPATGTYSYKASMGVANRAPDGSRWNATNIDATDFIITPDA